MIELQKWLYRPLGELARLYQPKTIASKLLTESGQFDVYGANGVIGKYDQYNHEEPQLIVTCRGATCGNVRITKPFSWINGNAMVVKPHVERTIELKFLEYFFSQSNITKSAISGSAQPQITRTTLAPILAPLPALPEQRAIVAKIERLFSELDNSIANFKKAQAQLKVYRQAVLKKAFELDSQQEVTTISQVVVKVQIGPFGSQLHKSDYIENGIPLINPMHLQAGKIVPNRTYSISTTKRDSLPNYILKLDDVVMGRRGEMGRCGLVTNKENGWFCGTGSLYLRPSKDTVYPKYLYYYLGSPVVKELLTGKATGTTMMNLNKKIINNLPFPQKPISNQIEIVEEIESRLSVCDKLEETLAESLEKAEALRQSILKKAFNGALLTPQELETCRQQPDWEPAEVLLERIKKEKLKTK